jgi:hypothetical protein
MKQFLPRLTAVLVSATLMYTPLPAESMAGYFLAPPSVSDIRNVFDVPKKVRQPKPFIKISIPNKDLPAGDLTHQQIQFILKNGLVFSEDQLRQFLRESPVNAFAEESLSALSGRAEVLCLLQTYTPLRIQRDKIVSCADDLPDEDSTRALFLMGTGMVGPAVERRSIYQMAQAMNRETPYARSRLTWAVQFVTALMKKDKKRVHELIESRIKTILHSAHGGDTNNEKAVQELCVTHLKILHNPVSPMLIRRFANPATAGQTRFLIKSGLVPSPVVEQVLQECGYANLSLPQVLAGNASRFIMKLWARTLKLLTRRTAFLRVPIIFPQRDLSEKYFSVPTGSLNAASVSQPKRSIHPLNAPTLIMCTQWRRQRLPLLRP